MPGPHDDSTSLDPAAPPTTPVVPADIVLPEITVKGVCLAIVLAAVLAGANAYLGLFAGMTVSASIPAAVVSMSVLRLFRRSNILENNIVQTAASSGEALAAGIIFTLPALVLLGYWQTFDYWSTTAIGLVGGLLGVLFTIPLRRALILEAGLRFPEGVATAEVLKVGTGTDPARRHRGPSTAGASVATLLGAAGVGGLLKVGEAGLRLWSDALEGTMQVGRSIVYLGLNLSPALVGVGFIIGLPIAVVVFLGGAVGWLILAPVYLSLNGAPHGLSELDAIMTIWSGKIRYVGIGGMLVGGLWTLYWLREPVWASLRQLVAAYRATIRPANDDGPKVRPRTEQDAPLPWIVGALGLSLIPMGGIYYHAVEDARIALIMTAIMASAAFLFASVAAYMAGLVGSSSNPVSGVTIATLMLAAGLLVFLMGRGHPAGAAAALLIGAVVCCAAAMGGDNLQDLKTGQLVGATPWKQQVMQVVGVVTGAVVLAPVLDLLQLKYGIGEVTAAHPHPLSAPQATLMASLARGVFGEGLPWGFVGLGAAIAVGIIGIDRWQAQRGSAFRLPVLAVALGIYLPLKLSATILLGGILAELARRAARPSSERTSQGGLLFAAGLITGEALMGILLAIPVALGTVWPAVGRDPLALFERPPHGPWPGVVAVVLTAGCLYHAATRDRSRIHGED